jgi:hypothetical protein
VDCFEKKVGRGGVWFLLGVLSFFCDFGWQIMVHLWRDVWLVWCLSGHIFGVETYATFLNFIFQQPIVRDGWQSGFGLWLEPAGWSNASKRCVHPAWSCGALFSGRGCIFPPNN